MFPCLSLLFSTSKDLGVVHDSCNLLLHVFIGLFKKSMSDLVLGILWNKLSVILLLKRITVILSLVIAGHLHFCLWIVKSSSLILKFSLSVKFSHGVVTGFSVEGWFLFFWHLCFFGPGSPSNSLDFRTISFSYKQRSALDMLVLLDSGIIQDAIHSIASTNLYFFLARIPGNSRIIALS